MSPEQRMGKRLSWGVGAGRASGSVLLRHRAGVWGWVAIPGPVSTMASSQRRSPGERGGAQPESIVMSVAMGTDNAMCLHQHSNHWGWHDRLSTNYVPGQALC